MKKAENKNQEADLYNWFMVYTKTVNETTDFWTNFKCERNAFK